MAAAAASSSKTAKLALDAGKLLTGSLDSPLSAEDFNSPVARELMNKDWRDYVFDYLKGAVSLRDHLGDKVSLLDALDPKKLPIDFEKGKLSQMLGFLPDVWKQAAIDKAKTATDLEKSHGLITYDYRMRALEAEALDGIGRVWAKEGSTPQMDVSYDTTVDYFNSLFHNFNLVSAPYTPSPAELNLATFLHNAAPRVQERTLTLRDLLELRKCAQGVASHLLRAITSLDSQWKIKSPEEIAELRQREQDKFQELMREAKEQAQLTSDGKSKHLPKGRWASLPTPDWAVARAGEKRLKMLDGAELIPPEETRHRRRQAVR